MKLDRGSFIDFIFQGLTRKLVLLIIAFIEDEEVIRKILKHLGLWAIKKRAPPKIKSPPFIKHISYELSDTGHPPFYPDLDYPVEMYIPQ